MGVLPPDELVRPLAVVAGASSRAGYDLARGFAERGYDLVIAWSKQSPRDGVAAQGLEDVTLDLGLEDVALDLAELGVEVQASRLDLSTYEGVEQLWGMICALARPVEVVVVTTDDRAGDLRAELALVQLTVTSVVHLALLVIADMVARGRGKVLFTSAVAPDQGPFGAVHAASAAFVSTFAQALRSELRGTGVSVTALTAIQPRTS